MKKFFACALAVSMLLSGCASSAETDNTPTDNNTNAVTEETPPVYITVDKEEYTLDDGKVNYVIHNDTGNDMSFSIAPLLYYDNNGTWEDVESNTGFCGVMDPLDETTEGIIDFDWYDDLKSGDYKFKLNTTEYEFDSTTLTDVSGKFTIK